MATAPAHTNRLASEQSPYLLQHAHNPVDWYPWGEEAFKAARERDLPIFLSVGYATCHWCHVMEHESFESEETAALLNKSFISVKVDREERPDVDRVYMTFVQASTGGGGWPMSVWLTPDLKAFYGGTYYPGKDQYGMPSFNTVLRRIASLWGTKRADLEEQASQVMQQLQEFTQSDAAAGAGAAGASTALERQRLLAAVAAGAQALARGFDAQRGGFGGAPKFPRPSEINLLLRAATEPQLASLAGKAGGKAASQELLLGEAMFSLQAMAAGGMYDQLGGGFHRYSVDEFFHVPHFEKMTYDNPQLALTYLDAFRIATAARARPGSAAAPAPAGDTGAGSSGSSSSSSKAPSIADAQLGDPGRYATVVRGVLDYLRRDMTHPEGGIYSAEDADSLDAAEGKKKEGAFYVWTADEVAAVLGPGEAGQLLSEVYGVEAAGNCTLSPRSDPHNEFGGKNVLMQFKRPDQASLVQAGKLSAQQAAQLLGEARRALFDARAQRPRPSLDDKIVTAWNGQAISAFALASRALAAEQPPAGPCFPVDGCAPSEYLQCALRIAGFIRARLWDEATQRLRRAYCKAPSAVEGFADDYAFLVAGLLDLYEAGGGLAWLRWAVQLQAAQDDLFWDAAEGGYFQGSGNDPSVLLRLKEDYDGAEPAPSSIAATNLLRLAALLPSGGSSCGGVHTSYSERADACIAAFTGRLEKAGIAMPQMLAAAWLRTKTPLRQVIISGRATAAATGALIDAAHAAWAPDKALLLVDPADPQSAAFWQQHNPEAWAMVAAHEAAAASATGGAAAAAASEAGAGAPAASEMAASEVAAAGGAQAASAQATAFVCQNFTCQAPTTSPARVLELLAAPSGGGGRVTLTPVQL